MLSAADLDQPAQAVVCNDCVEAATDTSSRPGPPAEPFATDEPAVADAQAEMDIGPDEPGDPTGDEPEAAEVAEPAPAEDLEPGEEAAGMEEVEPVMLDEDEALADDAVPEVLAVPDDDELPARNGQGAPSVAAGLDDEVPVPEEGEHAEVIAVEPAPAAVRPPDEGLVRRIEALEERLAAADETVNRLAEGADAQAAGAATAQAKKETDKLRRRLDQMGERLQELQATTDAEWARARAEAATLGQTIAELGERVVRLAEQAGDTAGAEDERLAAIETRVDEATTRLTNALEAQRRELQEGLRDGLADVLAAVPAAPAPADDHDARFRAMDRQLEQSRGEVSELNELHAALDAGLGALRGEIGDVRTALSRVVDSKADLEDRLETFVRMSLVPEDKGRKAKKTADSTLGTLSAAVQDLLREQRQLKDSFATLQNASDAATAAAARASMQASSLGPIRSDVKLLHQEVVEQQEALDALRRNVERLRQAAPPPPPPPAKKAAPAKKAVTAKKAAPVAKKAAKAPANRAPRAKKT